MHELLHLAADRAAQYLDGLGERAAAPTAEALAGLAELGGPLPHAPTNRPRCWRCSTGPARPPPTASAGGRCSFVVGGSLPAALAANWLASAWDQNAGMAVLSPVAAAVETIAQGWLLGALGLPASAGVGFVSGATMANFSGLAAARHALLKAGWDVEARGMFGAPPITVLVGDEVHVSALKALSLLGFGRDRVVRVPVDGQGRMRADALPPIDGLTIVCLQAGNVNSGASRRPIDEICAIAHDAGAWVHVDGAFWLWLAAAPGRAQLVRGIEQADSWAADAHKWLNVPYDSGLVICRRPEHLRAAMSVNAAYLDGQDTRGEPYQYTPEMSRRARRRDLGRAALGEWSGDGRIHLLGTLLSADA